MCTVQLFAEFDLNNDNLIQEDEFLEVQHDALWNIVVHYGTWRGATWHEASSTSHPAGL